MSSGVVGRQIAIALHMHQDGTCLISPVQVLSLSDPTTAEWSEVSLPFTVQQHPSSTLVNDVLYVVTYRNQTLTDKDDGTSYYQQMILVCRGCADWHWQRQAVLH